MLKNIKENPNQNNCMAITGHLHEPSWPMQMPGDCHAVFFLLGSYFTHKLRTSNFNVSLVLFNQMSMLMKPLRLVLGKSKEMRGEKHVNFVRRSPRTLMSTDPLFFVTMSVTALKAHLIK